jgi:hypothetical protein
VSQTLTSSCHINGRQSSPHTKILQNTPKDRWQQQEPEQQRSSRTKLHYIMDAQILADGSPRQQNLVCRHQIFGSSVWDLVHVNLLACRVLWWLLIFWKIYASLHYIIRNLNRKKYIQTTLCSQFSWDYPLITNCKWAVTVLLVSTDTSAFMWHSKCNKGKQ